MDGDGVAHGECLGKGEVLGMENLGETKQNMEKIIDADESSIII